MAKEEAWHRRHAIHIANELPDQPEDALIVLRLVAQLVTGFLAEPKPTQGRPVVSLASRQRSLTEQR